LPDIDKIRQLVEMMVANDLVELSVRDGDQEIKLRRPTAGTELVLAGGPGPSRVLQAAGSPPAAAEHAGSNGEATAVEYVEIRSPMVGTFYSAPDPDSAPYVKPGDRVGPSTVVCVLEAMKVFSEIKAEVSGTVERVLAKNGEAVEYGQPLFLVRPD
jgi:acetyl-CoA carboxylase biotin carboxyl carrier protein